jgi:hypothetical protein
VLALLLTLTIAATDLDEAQKAFAGGDYAKTVLTLENFLAREDLTMSERRDALLLQGAANYGLNLSNAATKKFADALALDPSVRPTKLAERLVRLIESLRKELYPIPVVTRGTGFTTNEGQSNFVVTLRLAVKGGDSPRRPKGVPLEFCSPEQGCEPLVVENNEATITKDLGVGTSAQVVWWVRTGDTQDEVLGTALSPERDTLMRLGVVKGDPPPPPPPRVVQPTPFYKQWWFWVPVSAVVVGAVTAGVVVGTLPRTGPATIDVSVVPSSR